MVVLNQPRIAPVQESVFWLDSGVGKINVQPRINDSGKPC